MATYETLSRLVGSGGLIYFAIIFVVVLVYALKPSNQKKFNSAARMPLEED
jgi:cytochrome c oxidase cbb3-type subunit IV